MAGFVLDCGHASGKRMFAFPAWGPVDVVETLKEQRML